MGRSSNPAHPKKGTLFCINATLGTTISASSPTYRLKMHDGFGGTQLLENSDHFHPPHRSCPLLPKEENPPSPELHVKDPAVAPIRPQFPDETLFLKEDEEPRIGGLVVYGTSRVLVYNNELKPIPLHWYFGGPPTILRALEISLLDLVRNDEELDVKTIPADHEGILDDSFGSMRKAAGAHEEEKRPPVMHPWNKNIPLFAQKGVSPREGQLGLVARYDPDSITRAETTLVWAGSQERWRPLYDYYSSPITKKMIDEALEEWWKREEEKSDLEDDDEKKTASSDPKLVSYPAEPVCIWRVPFQNLYPSVMREFNIVPNSLPAVSAPIDYALFKARRKTRQKMKEFAERQLSADITTLLLGTIEREAMAMSSERRVVHNQSFCRIIDQAKAASSMHQRLKTIRKSLCSTLDDRTQLEARALKITYLLLDVLEGFICMLAKPTEALDVEAHTKQWFALAHRDPKRRKLQAIRNKRVLALYSARSVTDLPAGVQLQLDIEEERTDTIQKACESDDKGDAPLWAIFLSFFEETRSASHEYLCLAGIRSAVEKDIFKRTKCGLETKNLLQWCARLLRRLETIPSEESFFTGDKKYAKVHLLHNLSLCMDESSE